MELRQLAAEEGAIMAIRSGMNLDVRSGPEALKYIYKAQTELATSPETGRSSTEAAKFVERGMGYGGDARSKGDTPVINIKIDNATLQAIQSVDDYEEEVEIIDIDPDEVPF
jgi:hypothetical protein